MANPMKPTRPAAWLTKQAMADVLDVTVNYFDREVRRYAKPEHVRQDGRRLMFYARGIFDVWYEARLQPQPEPCELGDFLLLDLSLPNDSTK